MEMESLRDLFIDQLKDIYSADARVLGDEKAASLLNETLEEESETDEKLNELAEGEINIKARDKGTAGM